MHRMNKTTKNWSKIRQKIKMKNRKKLKIKMLKELLSSKKMKKLKMKIKRQSKMELLNLKDSTNQKIDNSMMKRGKLKRRKRR